MNYLSTLSIFIKQTTYLATLPNPKIKGFVVSQDWNFARSGGDGKGEQSRLRFTFRSPTFFPHSKPDALYHFLRFEGMVAPSIGIPYAGGSIFTGQLNSHFP